MSNPPQREHLTEEQKKKNHLASERRRRENIRREFDDLCEAIPGMKGQGRSEHVVLAATQKYIRAQIAENKRLVAEAEAAGHDVKRFKLDQKIYEEAEQQDIREAERESARARGEDVESSDGEEVSSPPGRKRKKSEEGEE